MNPHDMKYHKLKKLDVVDITSHYDGKTRLAPKFLVIPYKIPSQNLACYFPEANTLVPIDQFADGSQTPISKSVKVKVKKVVGL